MYFGFPTAHEDDAYRAILAGLGMLDAMQRLNTRLEQEHGVRLSIRVGLVASSRKSTVMVRFARVCLAAGLMCHPQVLEARKWMKDEEVNTLKSCDNHRGLKTLPRNVMECGNAITPLGFPEESEHNG